MVPKDLKVKATELLWTKGLMGKVSMGTYEDLSEYALKGVKIECFSEY